ncbi:aromatic ring-hydroxylating dioxygenase subunit alpha [Burkholderia sp. Bp9126]|nr:aromatic ring-hydroxylating dioxygenase subunit alpha [Burkholderia sp. Bp9126]
MRSNGSAQREAALPPRFYLSNEIFEQELETIFTKEPRYVGTTQLVPNEGDFFTLRGENDGRILTRTPRGAELFSNVCKHRQAIMLNGRGYTKNIVCPLHRWTYDSSGALIGAPHFEPQPCRKLEQFPVHSWNELLFESDKPIDEVIQAFPGDILEEIDLSRYVFDRVEYVDCQYNWKTFLEFYLEDYHVDPFHPGLSQFLDCRTLAWRMGKQFSIQAVELKNRLQDAPATDVYGKWHSAVKGYYGENLPKYGAIWIYLYPSVMIEWYPMVLIVSTLTPLGPERTLNQIEFYHPDNIMLFEPDFIAGARAGADAYLETAAEDDEIGIRMQHGRHALWMRGASETGPYHSKFELGMIHFHNLYQRKMADALMCRNLLAV